MKNISKKKGCLVLFIVCPALLILFIYSPLFNYVSNRVALITSRGYSIPYESSLWDFKPLVPNSGSGEWWIYGEDKERYYFAGDGAIPHLYLSIRKDDAANCPGFQPTSFETWCTFDPPQNPGGG